MHIAETVLFALSFVLISVGAWLELRRLGRTERMFDRIREELNSPPKYNIAEAAQGKPFTWKTPEVKFGEAINSLAIAPSSRRERWLAGAVALSGALCALAGSLVAVWA